MTLKKTYDYNEACLSLQIKDRDKEALRTLYQETNQSIRDWKILFEKHHILKST